VPDNKLEKALLKRVPFKEGYRPMTPAEEQEQLVHEQRQQRLKEARNALWDLSPTFRAVEPEIGKITTAKWPSDIVGKVASFFDKNYAAYSPSFALALNYLPRVRGMININPEDIDNGDLRSLEHVLGHETGHIKQAMVGEPIRNDDSAEIINEEALKSFVRRSNAQPESIQLPLSYYEALRNEWSLPKAKK
jgi:hypothetical protein